MSEEKFGHDSYLSVFTWRYGSPEMRRIFSEIGTRVTWRKIWYSLAEAQHQYGLISDEELEDIRSKMGREHIDLVRAHQIEEQIKHDLMAEVKTYAEQAKIGGGKLHLGATSMDIEDNADVVKMRSATDLIFARLMNCLNSVSNVIEKYKELPTIAWTHIQPAGVTTLGYRLANYAQDLVIHIYNIEHLFDLLKGKGMKGIIGTSSSYKELLEGASPEEMEKHVMQSLGIDSYPVATQTYPRVQDYITLSSLAAVAATSHKFGLDLRLSMSPVIGELSEPIKKGQVGSSAAPWKQNPVSSERMCSLSRYTLALPEIAGLNAALSIYERTLDDSANRRIIIPESFMATDEILNLQQKILDGLVVRENAINGNIKKFWSFMATEPLLMELVKRGADRQYMHEKIRQRAFDAWELVREGATNPLLKWLMEDSEINSRIGPSEFDRLVNPSSYIGDAVERCDRFLDEVVRPLLEKHKNKIGTKAESKF